MSAHLGGLRDLEPYIGQSGDEPRRKNGLAQDTHADSAHSKGRDHRVVV